MLLRFVALFKPVNVKALQRVHCLNCSSTGSRCTNDDITADPYKQLEALFDQSAVWTTLTFNADFQTVDSQDDSYIYFGGMVVLNCSVGMFGGKHLNHSSDRLAFSHI